MESLELNGSRIGNDLNNRLHNSEVDLHGKFESLLISQQIHEHEVHVRFVQLSGNLLLILDLNGWRTDLTKHRMQSKSNLEHFTL